MYNKAVLLETENKYYTCKYDHMYKDILYNERYPNLMMEFLRRLLFRVQESVPVKEYDWKDSYGKVASYEETKEFFNIKDTDIYIPQPIDCNIYGDDIYDDTIALIESIKLEKEFDIQKIKKLKR